MRNKVNLLISANQYPNKSNKPTQFIRKTSSFLPMIGLISSSGRPVGISVVMRVKDEADWIEASVESIKGIAEEIIIVDERSSDGTYEILEECTLGSTG